MAISWSWGYVILVSKFMLLFIDTGMAKSFGVIIPMMVSRLDSDYASVGLICSMPATLMYLCYPFVTLALRTVNHRAVATFGGLLTGACVFACAFLEHIVPTGLCLALSGVGLSMTYVPLTLAINDFFREDFMFMNTFTFYGYTAGSMVLPMVTEKALAAYGYAGAFIILGGISFNLVVCGATIRKASGRVSDVRNQHEANDGNRHPDGPDCEQKYPPPNGSVFLTNGNRSDLPIRTSSSSAISTFTWMASVLQTCQRSCGILNEPLFLSSIPIHFLIFYTMYAWMLFLVPHAEGLGTTSSRAVLLSTIAGVGGVLGRTTFIVLVGRGLNIFIVYIVITTLCMASLLLDFISRGYTILVIMAFVQGFCFFIEDTVMAALNKNAIVDDRNFDVAYAISGFLGGLGATCSGYFTGYLFDVTQSFTYVFIIMGFIHSIVVVYLVFVAYGLNKRHQNFS